MRKLHTKDGKLFIGEVELKVFGERGFCYRRPEETVLYKTDLWWPMHNASDEYVQDLTGTDRMTLSTIWQMFVVWKDMPKALRKVTPFKTLLFPNKHNTP